jgi:glycosyltransferase involved in cell wall biosynthesis
VNPRILLLVTDLQIGGTPTVVRELATRLHGRGNDVQVACLDAWGPTADAIAAAGVSVTALNARGVFDVTVVARLGRLIHREKIDVVLSFLMHANVTAAAVSRLFPHVRWLQSIQTTQPTPRWHWVLQGIAQHAAGKIIVPSESVAKAAIDRSGVSPEKIVVIPNAVDVDSFAPLQRQPRGVTRVGFLGRLDPIKRVEDLIEAMTLLDETISLQIFGDGPERAKLEAQAARLNLIATSNARLQPNIGSPSDSSSRVIFHGAVASPREALAKIDLLVLPSAAEGFGLVLIEAMAAGVPVVATNVAGIRDVIQHDANGLLVPPGNPREIAGAIRRIFADEPLRNRLVKNGTAGVIERYDWRKIINQYESTLCHK